MNVGDLVQEQQGGKVGTVSAILGSGWYEIKFDNNSGLCVTNKLKPCWVWGTVIVPVDDVEAWLASMQGEKQ